MLLHIFLMRLPLTQEEQQKRERFSELAHDVAQAKAEQLEHRIAVNPSPTVEENALGAFLEMYDPHLIPMIEAFLKKGHIVDPLTGFEKDHPEHQVLYGTFSLDDQTISALSKINVIIHKETNTKFFKFSPLEPTIESIVQIFRQIVDLFPTLK